MESKLCLMHSLDQVFQSPSQHYRKIHVAGTNGKGSVVTKIGFALSELGFKTGVYTSPHIHTVCERIQIDGQMIEESVLQLLCDEIKEVEKNASFFAIMTMAAFIYFRDQQVDFAVIETGLGGIFDPTNIITPELSIITSISFDHMELLGNTLDEIASNKAGIIKKGVPVILSSRAVFPSVEKKIKEENAPLIIMPEIEDWVEESEAIAKKALSLFFKDTDHLTFSHAPPCRFEEIVMHGITFLFDIAHNEDGLKKLFDKLKKKYLDRKIFVMFGMSHDKCIDFAISLLKEKGVKIYPLDVENSRILKREVILNLLDIEDESFLSFMKEAKKERALVVVTGSAYIMHKAKEMIFTLALPSDLKDQDLEKCHVFL